MNPKRLDAAVAGAGIVGAALALGLWQRGLRVAVVEAAMPPAWRADAPDLRVYAIAPDSEALLERLGVWPAVRAARAQPYRAMEIWDSGGGRPLRFDADRLGMPRLGHIVEHGLLVDRLQAALRESGAVIREGHGVAAVREAADGVETVLADGAVLRSDWLFGADGARSAVREAAGIDVAVRDYAARGVVAYLRPELDHQSTCWQRFLPTGPLALLPCSEGRVSIVWSLPEVEAARVLALPEGAFEAELERASDRVLGTLRLDSPRAAFPLKRQLAARMHAGRVALLGDAAHTVHPLAGQGMNLGLRDVAALLDVIDAAIAARRPPLSDARLSRWARGRQSENALAAHTFDLIDRTFSNDAALPVALRGWALAAANAPPLNRALLRRAAGLA